MTGLQEEIIALEWEMFGQVHNIGGRAACQDNRETFWMMRRSQLAAWTPVLRESYWGDLQAARREGRNLLSEKYAHMMQRTNPREYARLRALLPQQQEEKLPLVDLISAAHVLWQEELARRYPCLSKRGRPVRQAQDSRDVTSFETYLRGELMTCSVPTLRLYAAYVGQLKKAGQNLCFLVLENMTRQYGYPSVEAAESHLAQSRTVGLKGSIQE